MSFDHIAPFYRAMEFITAGGKLQRCRTAFLDEIPAPANVLIAGEGHGKFLFECVRRLPEARIVVVDFSKKMLEIASSQVASDHVEFVCADVLEWEGPQGGFDLIVTNFFLDCFTADQLALVVSKLARCAKPDAQWLLADFEIAPTPLAGLRSRVIVGLLYLFFGIVTGLKTRAIVPPDRDLKQAGFLLHRRETHDWGLLKSEWWRR